MLKWHDLLADIVFIGWLRFLQANYSSNLGEESVYITCMLSHIIVLLLSLLRGVSIHRAHQFQMHTCAFSRIHAGRPGENELLSR